MTLENLTKNEIDGMTFADLAYNLLKQDGELNTANLYKKVTKLKGMSKQEYEDTITDFFAILNTDKRFLALTDGSWALKENHAIKSTFSELLVEEDNEQLIEEDHEEEEIEEEIELFVSEDDEFDDTDDDMANLVIIDEDELLEE